MVATVPNESGNVAGEFNSVMKITSTILYKIPTANTPLIIEMKRFLSLITQSEDAASFKFKSMITNINKTMIAPA